VKENAEMKETPVVPGVIWRGPKLMNSLEARSKEAAGRGAATKVGREFRGLVKTAEARDVSGVSSAMETGAGGRGALPPGRPGGPGGLRRRRRRRRRRRVQTSTRRIGWYTMLLIGGVPWRTSDTFAWSTRLAGKPVGAIVACKERDI
jgi:hypothetical protein